MLHKIPDAILQVAELPPRFTYPFCYTPHELCLYATKIVRTYLASQVVWQNELARGKMFGVLVVENAFREIGFVAAFSGNLGGSNQHDYFVPPIFDLLDPKGFFKEEEMKITLLNQEIHALEAAAHYVELKTEADKCRERFERRMVEEKNVLKEAKKQRDLRRKEKSLTTEQIVELVKESQFGKAEFRRIEKLERTRLDATLTLLNEYEMEISQRKRVRKLRSSDLQRRVFEQFEVLNAKGQTSNLLRLFSSTKQTIPPAGAGECAAPKLLQYAYKNKLRPVCMAEFWYGASPKGELRRDGDFYPACSGKCKPILDFMLDGLVMDENPLSGKNITPPSLSILYEDEWIVALNKPIGLLSVPGKLGQPSVSELLTHLFDNATPLLVHRLDMDTSGILLAAKTKEVHQQLQIQFEQQTIKKRYLALLDGGIKEKEGVIELPLSLDPFDRPRQKVDYLYGKRAITRYKVVTQHEGRTLLHFFPQTGRTHQLRVHAAHVNGLNSPIVGDALYGTTDTRLCLHAEWIQFVHPISREIIEITAVEGSEFAQQLGFKMKSQKAQ